MADRNKFVKPELKKYSAKKLLTQDRLMNAMIGIREIQTKLWETMPDDQYEKLEPEFDTAIAAMMAHMCGGNARTRAAGSRKQSRHPDACDIGKENDMEKKFNEEAYRNGSEVVCDVCGSVIEHINVKTRVIARQAEGFNVTEQYFTCQECGKKYTVLIVDHEMQFLIQKRQQVERQIKLHRQIRSRAQTIQRLIMKDEKIKKQQEERMIMLKEQYKEEVGS